MAEMTSKYHTSIIRSKCAGLCFRSSTIIPITEMANGPAQINAYFLSNFVALTSPALLAYQVKKTADINSTADIARTTILQVKGLVNRAQ